MTVLIGKIITTRTASTTRNTKKFLLFEQKEFGADQKIFILELRPKLPVTE